MCSYGLSLHGYEKGLKYILPFWSSYLVEGTNHGGLSQLHWNGNGIYDAQATAQIKFGTTAAKLTRGQCALIAATLPNPIRFNSAKPSPYILTSKQILRLMNLVPKFPPEEKTIRKQQGKNKKTKKEQWEISLAPFTDKLVRLCTIPIIQNLSTLDCKRWTCEKG